MKILFVTPYFYPAVGGLENYVLHIAEGLQKKHGCECIVLTTSPKKRFEVEKKKSANHISITNPVFPFKYTVSSIMVFSDPGDY